MNGTGKTNWLAIWISAAVVVALVAVGIVVVWMNNQATGPGTAPKADFVNAETGAISIGDNKDNVLDEYVDFMCPICGQYFDAYGETVQGLVDDGSLTLNLHPISILDRYSQGTKYSTRAANAMYCVADESKDAVVPFLELLFANQPEEQSEGLPDEQLITMAGAAGAEGAEACITDGTYKRFVTSITEKTPIQPGQQGIGTPTVVLNGEFVTLSGDPQADIVDQLK
ncbi:DsbA family protein [Microbacterium phosphatis]|uniref:DsbA family protein n=1 Tax=Microbacterium phosphatis TaxID=3140248 RepID=UPI0031406952